MLLESFRYIRSIIELFKNNMDDERNIMGVIADIKKDTEATI